MGGSASGVDLTQEQPMPKMMVQGVAMFVMLLRLLSLERHLKLLSSVRWAEGEQLSSL